jgi:hypothetical protein
MDKISGAQAQQLLKVAAASVRSLSQANQKLTTECGDLKTKVASYERKEHAEKIASLMEEKGVNAELSFQDKVASLLEGDRNLDVVEEALNLGAPHIKVASIDEESNGGGTLPTDDDVHGDAAASNFVAGLATD